MNKTAWVVLVIIVIAAILGVYWYDRGAAQKPMPSAGIANPASVNCVDKGGQLEIVEEAGGAAGYCHLPDGRVCEEWSLFRGGCTAPNAASSTAASSTVR